MHSTLPSTEALIVYTALFLAAMKRECHSNDQAAYSASAHPNAAHHVRLLSKSGKERAWAHWVVLSYAMMMDRMEPAFVTITHQSVRLANTLSISMIGLKFLIITCKRFMFLARVSTKGQGEAHGKKTDANICLVRSVEKHGTRVQGMEQLTRCARKTIGTIARAQRMRPYKYSRTKMGQHSVNTGICTSPMQCKG